MTVTTTVTFTITNTMKITITSKILIESAKVLNLLADPSKAKGCSTNTFVIHWLSEWVSDPLVKISLRSCHTQTVKNGASNHRTNYIEIFSEILNLEGHQNRYIGLKVKAIFLNGWSLPTGGASSGRVCVCSLCSRVLYINISTWLVQRTHMFHWPSD